MTVGVLLLENTHLRGPGSMAHSESYGGMAIFRTMTGVMGRELMDRPDLVREAVIDAALELAADGADAITMNCGFGVLFQRDVAQAAKVATACSSLVLLPVLAALHGGHVGVLTYDRSALTPAHFDAAGWPPGAALPLSADVQAFPEWRLLEEEGEVALDLETMEAQLATLGESFVAANGLSALVLECSAMVPFKGTVKRKTGCHVYDVLDAVELARRARQAS